MQHRSTRGQHCAKSLRNFGSSLTIEHRGLQVSSEIFPRSINSQSLQLHTLSEVSQGTPNGPINKLCFTPSLHKSYYIYIKRTSSLNPTQLLQHFTGTILNGLLSDSRKNKR